MDKKEKFVFQTDSEMVNIAYENNDNYLVEFDETKPKKYCVLYFSSNNIYFPNEPSVFQKTIVQKNNFEWFGTRVEKGHKHIFLRDLKKQWYLSGINAKINSPSSLLAFLEEQTKNYSVITVGSSAGGFAAVLYGQLIGARTTYTFNGQFEVNSLLHSSNELIDPLIFRERNNVKLKPFYDLKPFIKNPNKIHYFYSMKSPWDQGQYAYIRSVSINIYRFKTNNHGIPFIKSTLPKLLNLPIEKLHPYLNHNINPLLFSIQIGGFVTTVKGLWKIIKLVITRRFRQILGFKRN